jgi:hypothetical protein
MLVASPQDDKFRKAREPENPRPTREFGGRGTRFVQDDRVTMTNLEKRKEVRWELGMMPRALWGG